MISSFEPLENRVLLAASPVPAATPTSEPSLVQLAEANRAPTAVLLTSGSQGAVPLTVFFDASASRDPDHDALRFVWDFGDGSPREAGALVQHTYQSAGVFVATLLAIDAHGGKDLARVRVLAGETAPQPHIIQPDGGTLFRRGDRIFFEGEGTDLEDGLLPGGSFVWTVRAVAGARSRRLLPPIVGRSGSFVVPNLPFFSSNQFISLTLTVTDSAGLRASDTVVLRPELAPFALRTNFDGLALRINGRTVITPEDVLVPAGQRVIVSAPSRQVINGNVYVFEGWTDAGRRTHRFRVPPGGTSLFAVYDRVKQAEPRFPSFFDDPDNPFSTLRITLNSPQPTLSLTSSSDLLRVASGGVL